MQLTRILYTFFYLRALVVMVDFADCIMPGQFVITQRNPAN